MSYIGWITLALFLLGLVGVGQFYFSEEGTAEDRMGKAWIAGFGFIFLVISLLMFMGRLFYMAFFS